MANRTIIDYISAQFAAGFSEQQIREALAAKNWPQAEVDEAFASWKSNPVLPDRKEIGTFVSQTWHIYKELMPKYFTIIKLLALRFLKYLIPGLVFGIVFYLLSESGGFENLSTLLSVLAAAAFVGYLILFIYMSIWLSVAYILVIRGRHSGVTPEAAMAMGQPLIGAYFWTSFLTGVLTFLWALLLIVPGIIMGVYYALSTYIVVDKNLNGMDAIRKSKEYLTGLWWQFVFSLLSLGLVVVGVYILDGIAQAIFVNIDSMLGPVLYSAFSIALNFLFAPFLFIYMYLLYERVKTLKPEVN